MTRLKSIMVPLQNALLSAVPFLCNWLVSILYSSSLDKCISKKFISITNARKLSQVIGENMIRDEIS